jgi:hypothetical protein
MDYLAMSFKMKFSKAAHVTNSIDVNSEFSEKVDNLVTIIRQRKPQDKWRCQYTQNFLQKDQDLQIIECAELSFDLSLGEDSRHTSSEWSLPFQ